MNIPIIMTICNGREQIVKQYTELFNRFWSPSQEVIVLGFENPGRLPSNFTFESMGKQTPANQWSTPIRSWIEANVSQWFIYLLEDLYPVMPILSLIHI